MGNRRPKNWLRTLTFGVFSALMALAPLTNVPLANAAAGNTVVWTGAGDGVNFSDGDNWQGGVAPVAGDTASFQYVEYQNPTYTGQENNFTLNDNNGVALGGLIIGQSTESGLQYQSSGYTIDHSTQYTISNLKLGDGATITRNPYGAQVGVSTGFTVGDSLTINGSTSPLGVDGDSPVNITVKNLTYTNAPQICGMGGDAVTFQSNDTLTLTNGSYAALSSSEKTVTVDQNSVVGFYNGGTIAANITFAGGKNNASTDHCAGQSSLVTYGSNTTLTGKITLNGNVYYSIANGITLTLKGQIDGAGFALKPASDSYGKFVNSSTSNDSDTKSGSQQAPVKTLPTIKNSEPSEDLTVNPRTIVVLDGSRGNVYVNGGTLKGDGSATSLTADGLATVAPGHSPGTLTVRQSYNQYDATYQAEIQNTSNYDKLVVGKNFTPQYAGQTAVQLSSSDAKLNVVLYKGWSIKRGDKFTIIDNQSNTAVTGTFKGLQEGAHLTVNGVTFSITYKGGTGNDVVLTALNSKSDTSAPDTGMAAMNFANPLVVTVLGFAAAGALLVLAKRSKVNR